MSSLSLNSSICERCGYWVWHEGESSRGQGRLNNDITRASVTIMDVYIFWIACPFCTTYRKREKNLSLLWWVIQHLFSPTAQWLLPYEEYFRDDSRVIVVEKHGDINARRQLFASHSHDIVLLFACLRIGVSWHNFNVTTAKRMLIGVSKSHKISKGYGTRITTSAKGWWRHLNVIGVTALDGGI